MQVGVIGRKRRGNPISYCRWWREAGEDPNLWAKLKLCLLAWGENLDDLRAGDTLFTLKQVLSLKRLQSLEYLVLRCWAQNGDQTRDHLQTALEYCPKIRELTVDFQTYGNCTEENCMKVEAMVVGRKSCEEKMSEVAAMFLKFEDVRLTWAAGCHKGRVGAILRGVVAALSGEGSKLKILTMYGSKLKILTMSGEEKKKYSAELAELREAGVTVYIENVDNFRPEYLSDSSDSDNILWSPSDIEDNSEIEDNSDTDNDNDFENYD